MIQPKPCVQPSTVSALSPRPPMATTSSAVKMHTSTRRVEADGLEVGQPHGLADAAAAFIWRLTTTRPMTPSTTSRPIATFTSTALRFEMLPPSAT